MKKSLVLLLVVLALVGVVYAQSTVVQTLNTVPASNATFLSDLQNFLREEDADRYANHFVGMVVGGGTHGTGAGLTKTPSALTAYTDSGHYITETGAITYPNADTCWVIASSTSSGNLGTFTRVSGTKYLTDCASGSKPSLPSGALWLMEVTTAGSAVTVVTDLRTRVSYAGTFLQAELPTAGVRGRIAFVRDSGSGGLFVDNGTAWVSVGISNAMTTAGDIIVGGAAGAPTRQACATAGTVLIGGTPSCIATPTVTTLTTSGQNAVSVGPYGAGAGNTGEKRFLELAANGTNYVGFKAPDSVAGNVVWALPNADGSANQALITNGSGTLSFVATTLPRSYLAGLTLSNNGSDATNDIDIAAGQAVDDGNAVGMSLASSYTKRTDAAWVVGTNQGCLDTGAVGNNTYHFFLIRRTDTGVVDVLCSTSASAPTMPSGYSQKRRVGSVIRSGGAILAFKQVGNYFRLAATRDDLAAAPGVTTALSATLTVPIGVKVTALFRAGFTPNAAGDVLMLSDLDANDEVASSSATPGASIVASSTTRPWHTFSDIKTNTSGQIRYRMSVAASAVFIQTFGWLDVRGRDD